MRRGLLLWAVGLAFDELWPGTILVYYGAMFVVAALLWRLPSLAVAAVGVGSAVAGFTHSSYRAAPVAGVTGPGRAGRACRSGPAGGFGHSGLA